MVYVPKKRLAAIAAATLVGLAGLGVGIGLSVSSGPPQPKAVKFVPPISINDTCTADDTKALGAWLYSLPQGTPQATTHVAFGKGCYEIDGSEVLRDFQFFEFTGGTFKETIPEGSTVPPDIGTGDWSGLGPARPCYGNPALSVDKSDLYTLNTFDLMFFFECGNDITFKNASFVGPLTPSTAGNYHLEQDTLLTFAGTQGALVTNSKFDGSLGDCVDAQPAHEVTGGLEYLYPPTDITVTDSKCLDTGRQGLSVIQGDRIAFTHDALTGIHATAFDVEEDAIGGYENDINISDNTIVGLVPFDLSAQTGSQIDRLAFDDNRMIDGAQMRIVIKDKLEGTDVRISGNTATSADSGSDFTQSPISIAGVEGSSTEVDGNTFPLDVGRIVVPALSTVCGNVLTPAVKADAGVCPNPSPVTAPAPPALP